jgi:3-deoxy-D-manno-octulosonic-acid transferase
MPVLAWLLDAIYAALLVAGSPWLAYRRWVQRKPIAGLGQKLSGRIVRQHPDRPCVWFHAVSVGEVLQLPSLVDGFLARHPGWEVLITTTTGTGFDVARQKFLQHTVAYWPLDFRRSVTNALQVVRPELVVLVELELWPNFLLAANRLGVPVVLANARLSAKSYRGYRWLKPVLRPILQTLSQVAAQTEEYAARLIDLGIPAERVTVTGNIKYDRVQSDHGNPKTAELRAAFGLADDALVFIAGSTQDPEERYALEAYRILRGEFPPLRLVLVPRHKERFEEVAGLISESGFAVVRRSQKSAKPPAGNDATGSDRPVLLLDTLGELGACWGLADVAFVGGSLTNRGGQNMLEPAGYGAAVLFGPNTWNFRDIVEQLLARNAALVIRDRDELRDTVRRLLADPAERQRLGQTARAFVLTQQGATQATLDLIDTALPMPATRAAA